MPTTLSDELKQKIVLYAKLAAGNLHQSGSNEPTEDMGRLAAEIGMGHDEIILAAAELTLGTPGSSPPSN